jgi:hypothetical protein
LVENLARGELGEVVVIAVVADDATRGDAEHGAVREVGAGRGAAV